MQTPKSRHQDTDTRLLEALQKILEGKNSLTDGRFTKSNIAKEAGLSLSTLNRSQALQTAWANQVRSSAPRNPAVAEKEKRLAAALKKQRLLQARCRSLEDQLEAAKMVIAQMYVLNVELSAPDSQLAMKQPNLGRT